MNARRRRDAKRVRAPSARPNPAVWSPCPIRRSDPAPVETRIQFNRRFQFVDGLIPGCTTTTPRASSAWSSVEGISRAGAFENLQRPFKIPSAYTVAANSRAPAPVRRERECLLMRFTFALRVRICPAHAGAIQPDPWWQNPFRTLSRQRIRSQQVEFNAVPRHRRPRLPEIGSRVQSGFTDQTRISSREKIPRPDSRNASNPSPNTTCRSSSRFSG